MHSDTRAHRIAARQGGVITRAQAIAAGMTRNQIDSRIRTKRWQRVVLGGYRIFEMDGRFDRVRSAVALLPGAVASHFSAADIHGMTKIDTRTASVTVHSRTTHTFPGVRVFRCHDLAKDHVVDLVGIPTTTVARTVVDLAPLISPAHLGVLIDDTVTRRLVNLDQIRGLLHAVARRGKPGVTKLRRALDEREGPDHSATVLEAAGNRLLVNAGITGFQTEYPIPWMSGEKRFDVAFPQLRLAIEWDSRRWHGDERGFETDRARDRSVVMNGWRILRFTWKDVHDRPQMVIDTVLAAHTTGSRMHP